MQEGEGCSEEGQGVDGGGGRSARVSQEGAGGGGGEGGGRWQNMGRSWSCKWPFQCSM